MKIMVHFAIRRGDPCDFTQRYPFDSAAIFKLNFLKPTLFSFGYDYDASARMVAPQLDRQIVLTYY